MKTNEQIKAAILNVIDKDIARTEKELEEYEQKLRDNESYYGCGGFYRRFEKCIEKRERHIEDIKEMRKTFGVAVQTDRVTVWSYYCPTCQTKVMLSSSFGKDVVDCPVCRRTIYKANSKEYFDVVRGSRFCEVQNEVIQLMSDGRVKGE